MCGRKGFEEALDRSWDIWLSRSFQERARVCVVSYSLYFFRDAQNQAEPPSRAAMFGTVLWNTNKQQHIFSQLHLYDNHQKNIKIRVCKQSGHISREVVKDLFFDFWEREKKWRKKNAISVLLQSEAKVDRGVKKHKRKKLAWEIGWCWCC